MPVINPQLIKSKTSWYRGGVYCMHGRNFVVKVWGKAWYETNLVIGSMQKWRFLYADSPSYL